MLGPPVACHRGRLRQTRGVWSALRAPGLAPPEGLKGAAVAMTLARTMTVTHDPNWPHGRHWLNPSSGVIATPRRPRTPTFEKFALASCHGAGVCACRCTVVPGSAPSAHCRPAAVCAPRPDGPRRISPVRRRRGGDGTHRPGVGRRLGSVADRRWPRSVSTIVRRAQRSRHRLGAWVTIYSTARFGPVPGVKSPAAIARRAAGWLSAPR